jgi:hypothetical protein
MQADPPIHRSTEESSIPKSANDQRFQALSGLDPVLTRYPIIEDSRPLYRITRRSNFDLFGSIPYESSPQ